MMNRSEALLIDVGVGLAAGAAATRMAAPIQTLLYRFTPDAVKKREEQVRPGPPTKIAAKDLAASAGVELDEHQIETAASAVHYASGLPWGVVYTFLRRHSGMTAVGAALATGASMSLILDEALAPAMGFSVPDREYPTGTHARGFIAHLAFGAVVGVTAEALYRLTRTAPQAGDDRH
jgi:uncharacterized membrane protein YagU involved in acid resistance